MKRFNYLIAILLMACTFSAFSQSASEIRALNKSLNVSANHFGKFVTAENINPKSEKTQALTWEQIELCYQPLFFTHYSRCTPIAYDPFTNLVIVAGIQTESSAQGLSKIMGEVYYKQPAGTRWDSTKIFNEADMGIVNPSIAINNYSEATNFDALALTMLGRFAPSYNEWRFTGLTYVFKDGGEIVPELSEYPENNNPGGQYSWTTMKLKAMPDQTESYAAGMLSTTMETQVQYGAYGFLSMDVTSQTALQSKIPSEWATSLFRSPPALTSSYNASLELAVDNDNNVYAAVNNMFADDENNRVPAVSKSGNGGQSWSAFNRMPANLLETYRQTTSHELIGAYDVYNQMNGFVAWGNNSYSYFYPVFLASQDTIREIHIIEAKCTNSTNWSIVKVAELNGFTPWVFYDSDLYPNATDRFRLANGFLGYEIQASKTADGQYLIVKWVDQGLNPDNTGKVANFASPVPVTALNDNGEEVDAGTINSMTILDIFIARRNINNSNWSVINATNDIISYKATWIPDIVPAVNSIPIIYSSTPTYQAQDPFNNLPQAMRDRVVGFPAFFFFYSRVTEPLDVEETVKNHNFNVFSVYPNPVTDLAEFTFELNEPANVRIEITNALGQIVKVVYDNYTSEGLQGFNADLSDLSNGVYYYTLTAGNQRATKVLNVIK